MGAAITSSRGWNRLSTPMCTSCATTRELNSTTLTMAIPVFIGWVSLFDATEHLTRDGGRLGARCLVQTNHEQNLRLVGRHHCNNKTITRRTSEVYARRGASLCQGIGMLEGVV